MNTTNSSIMTKLIATPLLTVFLSSLVACGGGGGDTGSESASAPQTPSPIATPAPDPIQVSSSSELTVAEGFDLNSEADLSLAVDLNSLDSHRGYLSVCSDFELDGETVSYVNYDSCLLRTWVNANGYTQSLTVTHDVNGLVAALWYPELESVDYALWQRDEGMQWVFD